MVASLNLLMLLICHIYDTYRVDNWCCSFEYFRTNCPFYVIKLKANDDWGTCLCDICLNPELKSEALAKTIGDNDLKWGDNKEYKVDNIFIYTFNTYFSTDFPVTIKM